MPNTIYNVSVYNLQIFIHKTVIIAGNIIKSFVLALAKVVSRGLTIVKN